MGLKSKLFGLGAALTLGLTIIAPASAAVNPVGTVPVAITVTDAGGSLAVGVGSSSGFDFGSLAVNASESGTLGVKSAGTANLSLAITGDTSLFNANGFEVTVRLDNGTGAGAFLAPAVQPTFTDSAPAIFQIPGRYLKISAIGNPQQAKFSGSSSCANVWNGSGTTSAAQCAPRVAVGTQPIYKTSDPVGLMGQPDNGSTCRVASGNVLVNWDTANCLTNAFTTAGGKQILRFRPGSGTVATIEALQMTLDVPAGVYPTTYTGVLVVEQVVS